MLSSADKMLKINLLSSADERLNELQGLHCLLEGFNEVKSFLPTDRLYTACFILNSLNECIGLISILLTMMAGCTTCLLSTADELLCILADWCMDELLGLQSTADDYLNEIPVLGLLSTDDERMDELCVCYLLRKRVRMNLMVCYGICC